jgi:hypothetical protein
VSVVSGVFAGNSLFLSQRTQEDLRKQQTGFQKTGQNLQVEDLQAVKKAANALLDTTTFSSSSRNQALAAAANMLGSALQEGSLTGAQNAARQIRSSVESATEGKSKMSGNEAPPAMLNTGASMPAILAMQKSSTPNDSGNSASSEDSSSPSRGSSLLDVLA